MFSSMGFPRLAGDDHFGFEVAFTEYRHRIGRSLGRNILDGGVIGGQSFQSTPYILLISVRRRWEQSLKGLSIFYIMCPGGQANKVGYADTEPSFQSGSGCAVGMKERMGVVVGIRKAEGGGSGEVGIWGFG